MNILWTGGCFDAPGGSELLTHWDWNKMDDIFSDIFSHLKRYVFLFRFLWNLFPWVQLTISQHWFIYWLGTKQATSQCLNQWWPSWLMLINVFITLSHRFTLLFYCQTSNIRHPKSPNLKCFSSCLVVVFAQSIQARCSVKNEDVVGAALTSDAPTTSKWSIILSPTKVWLILLASLVSAAPTTSKWSIILLPTKVWLILEVWWYM